MTGAFAIASNQMPCDETEHTPIVVPERVRHEDCVRRPVAEEIVVPEVF